MGGSQAERCTKTDANGRYTITSLKSGEYTVEFYSYPSTRYPVHYYGGEHTRSEAQHVKVSAGVTTADIDAELIEPESAGSHIRGVVSSASSGQPIAGIEVCAYDAAEEAGLFGRCATTEAGGEYSLSGLSSGEYFVEFSSPYGSGLNYVTQYYNGVASPEKATAVMVGPETVDIGIDARMSEGGRIGGEVTDASTSAPIQGISVCAYTEESETPVGACANTGQNGQYTIAGLPAGEYTVEFSSPSTGELDYVRQYFDGQSSAKTATLVPVTVGATSSGVNAAMHMGGRVTGRVRSAATGPLADALVCALSTPTEAVACALSNRNGEYAIAGLSAGSYVIGFDAAKPYEVQYYNDQATYDRAQPVEVTVGADTAAVNATLLRPEEPGSLGPPPIPPKPPIPHGVTPVVPPAPAPPTSTSPSTSPSMSPQPSVPSPVDSAIVSLSKPTSLISGHTAQVALGCGGSSCAGTVELSMQVPIRKHGDTGRSRATRHATVVLARGSFALADGQRAIVTLLLTAAGKRNLKAAERHPVAGEITLTLTGGKAITTHSVLIR